MLNLNLLKTNDNKNKSVKIEEISSKEIAVIGAALKLPKADGKYSFWNNLELGIDCVTGFPENRKTDVDDYLRLLHGSGSRPEYDIGSYLEEIDKFDYEYFKTSPKEASLMDPNQRLFLQTSLEALEDAGYNNDKINGSKTGVYVGFHETLYNYRQMIAQTDPSSISLSLPGNLSSIIASRISYFLNLTGPSLIVDTACSSSLVAVHLACQGIKSGDCDMAIAGGVRINLIPLKRDFRFGVESSSGRSRAFDESADGISSGEGVAAVVLKPLSRALMDKDNIYAVIKGSAINQDGSTAGITAPNVAAQEDVIIKAWKDASVDPEDISFIETHGTGTKIGDPIEIEGIQRAFKRYTNKKQFCAIGSLKTNLGHLDNAAGIAGFIKTILQLKYKKIAPLLHFNRPNSRIAFAESPLYVNDRLSDWDAEGKKRLCGVSSFGLSGTNCHVIIEEAPEYGTKSAGVTPADCRQHILTVSSHSKAGIIETVNQYDKFIEANIVGEDRLLDFCHTANACRKKYNYRSAVIFSCMDDLKNKLKTLSNADPGTVCHEWFYYGHTDAGKKAVKDSNDEFYGTYYRCDFDTARKICGIFVKGADFDWNEFYKGSDALKISLPTYPFKKNRCWLDIKPDKREIPAAIGIKTRVVLNSSESGPKKQIRIKGRDDDAYSEYEKIISEVFCSVLGYDEIDVNADIFDMGVDSIIAVKIINELEDKYKISSDISGLLNSGTINAFSELAEKNGRKESSTKSGLTENSAGTYELSYSQKRLWLLNKIDSTGVAYNMPGVYEIDGNLDMEILLKAFKKATLRHESLRTVFTEEDGVPVQKILNDPDPVIDYLDLSDDKDKKTHLKEMINVTINHSFDLSRWPLMKLLVVKTGNKKYVLMFNMHHIISDGWSFAVFIKELLASYGCMLDGTDPGFVPLEKQYVNYVQDQARFIESDEFKAQENFWLGCLGGNLPVLNLAYDHARPSRKSFKGNEVKFTIDEKQSSMIKDFCRQLNITPNVFFLTVYSLVLNKFTGDRDMIIGSLVSGRNRKNLELIIGNFINYLPVRITLENGIKMKDFFTYVRTKLADTYSNQDYPFDMMIEKLARNINPSGIYDTMMIYHSKYFLQDEYELNGLKLKYVEIGENKSVLDLKLDIFEYDMNKFVGKLQYSTDLFEHDTMCDFVGRFNRMTGLILENSGMDIDSYELFTDEEKSSLSKKREHNCCPLKIAVSGSFTAEPVKDLVEYLCKLHDINVQVEFAPYNQVFQELLDADSLLSMNRGINVILFRFEDFIRLTGEKNAQIQKIDSVYSEFCGLLKSKKINIPHLVALFPVNGGSGLCPEVMDRITGFYERLKNDLLEMNGIYLLDLRGIKPLYDIENEFDIVKDAEGHMPFSDEFYAAMAARIARFACAYTKTRFKAIVVDCDNTLWGGICGEDGPDGISLDSTYLEFQKFIKSKKDEGFLLAINSKNNFNDVMRVLETIPGMILKKEDFVNFKINWNSKADNIVKIAEELNLGTDSFIFIDDSFLECEEMMTYRPEVLTIRLPDNREQLPAFMNHIWAFDAVNVTLEDKFRTEMYKADENRKKTKENAVTLESFIENLQINMSMSFMENDDIARISQMTQRTNQFNLSTKRRTISEIGQIQNGTKNKIWTIRVTDKFGDYGISGAVITEEKEGSIDLDTMLLSCRILGKKIEDGVLYLIGKYASECGKELITAKYIRTEKNNPVKIFLDSSGWKIEKDDGDITEYSISVKDIPDSRGLIACHYKEKIACLPSFAGREEPASGKNAVIDKQVEKTENDWNVFIANENNLVHKNHLSCLKYYSGKKLLEIKITGSAASIREEYCPPSSKMEKDLAEIWEQALNADRIGINDNFFNLGGNSLIAVRLASMINMKLKKHISLNDIFTRTTIRSQASFLSQKEECSFQEIQQIRKKDKYPLSWAQKRLFIINKFDESDTSFNMPLTFVMEGKVDKNKIEHVFNILVSRHESLRTSFAMDDGEPVQMISDNAVLELAHYKENDDGKIKDLIGGFVKPFDLTKPPLLRAGVIEISPQKNILLFDMHHIISDGTSLLTLADEFIGAYNGSGLPEIKIQYKDFTAWQNEFHSSEKIRKQEEYWLSVFKENLPSLNMPLDYPRKNGTGNAGDAVEIILDRDVSESLQRISAEKNATMFITLLTAFNVFFSRLSGQNDIILGTPTAGRTHIDVKNIVGIFLNTIALRNYPAGNKTFSAFLDEVRENTIRAFENQDYQFENLLEKINVKRETGRNPLFDILINFLPGDIHDMTGLLKDIKIHPYKSGINASKFDMTIYINDVPGEMKFSFVYKTELFKRKTVEYLASEFFYLLKSIASDTERKIGDYGLFSPARITEKRKKIIIEKKFDQFERSELSFSIIDRFEKQAAKYPSRMAVRKGNEHLTYDDLNRNANALANEMLKNGEIAGTRIGLIFEHGTEMIEGILGVLKTGAAYVPIDPRYPDKRMIDIINDAGIKSIITDSKNAPTAGRLRNSTNAGLEIIDISRIDKKTVRKNPGIMIEPGSIAYILYTSGSTGKPKGVVQNHRNVLHFIRVYTNNLHIDPSDRMTLFSTYCFDASVMDIFGALLNGACLYPLNIKEGNSLWMLFDVIDNERLTIFHSTPTLYRFFINAIDNKSDLTSIRLVVMGGEAVYKNDLDLYRKHFTDKCIFINGLGPTESTVTMQCFFDKNYESGNINIPVGYPVEDTEVYIMTDDGRKAGIYETGELLYKSGHLALGYWNLPELTDRAFVKDPFTGEGITYRSGDLGRMLPDGSIEFHGRKDFQIKIRGFRIETGEIESKMDKIPEIEKSIVIPVKKGDSRFLAGYYKLKDGMNITKEKIKILISEELPEYMIPVQFVEIKTIPLTSTGKVDRNSLPEITEIKSEKEFISPTNDMEKLIAGIYEKILNVNKAGIDDDFFELGGNSLLAIKAEMEFEKNGINLKNPDIFKFRTVRKLALISTEKNENTCSSILKVHNQEYRGDIDIDNLKINVDVPLILCGDLNCLDSLTVSVLASKGIEHDLAFCNSWNFSYVAKSRKYPNSIGERISTISGSIGECLSNYYNIKLFMKMKMTPQKVYKIIEENLYQGIPVIIKTDLFYCSWSQIFKKQHSTHFCMVTGLDADGNPFCLDTAPRCNGAIMKLDDFYESCDGCMTIDFMDYRKSGSAWRQILGKTAVKIEKNGSMKALKNFCDDFLSVYNVEYEMETCKHSIENSSIIWKILRIYGARNLFARTLKHLGETNGVEGLISISDKITDAANKWYDLRYLIIKNMYDRENADIIRQMDEIVSGLTKTEESAFNDLKNSINN